MNNTLTVIILLLVIILGIKVFYYALKETNQDIEKYGSQKELRKKYINEAKQSLFRIKWGYEITTGGDKDYIKKLCISTIDDLTTLKIMLSSDLDNAAIDSIIDRLTILDPHDEEFKLKLSDIIENFKQGLNAQ